MGFGVLFIGYFLLLNITYFQFTDLISGLVLTLAFNKLSGVNKYFKFAQIPTAVFSLLGLGELGVGIYTMFFSQLSLTYYNIAVGIIRYALIGAFTLLMLLGIENVANEVDLEKLPRRARVTIPFSLTVLLLCAVFEIPFLSNVLDKYTLTLVGLALLCGFMLIAIFNLAVIYNAYMNICMPNQREKEKKRSRFKFVEGFREHEEKRRMEYVEYKINKRKGKKK